MKGGGIVECRVCRSGIWDMCAFDSGWGKSSEAFVHLSAQRIAMMIKLGG